MAYKLSELNKLKDIQQVYLEAGTLKDFKLNIRISGNSDKPILIMPQTPNSVKLTGTSSLVVSGSNIILAGIQFVNGGCPKAVSLVGDNIRLTDCTFSYNNCDMDCMVQVSGTRCRIDHCTFRNISKKGVLISVLRSEPKENFTLIESNTFINRYKDSKELNGFECIRLGTSTNALSSSKSIVMNNYFERCNAELEIISVKSSDNIIFGNTFFNCEGTLSLRHGNRNFVYKNFFNGNRNSKCGGIRIMGENHRIIDNLISSFRPKSGFLAPICLVAGEQTPKPEGYVSVKQCTITKNIFCDCNNIFALGFRQNLMLNVPPSDVDLSGNFYSGKKPLNTLFSKQTTNKDLLTLMTDFFNRRIDINVESQTSISEAKYDGLSVKKDVDIKNYGCNIKPVDYTLSVDNKTVWEETSNPDTRMI